MLISVGHALNAWDLRWIFKRFLVFKNYCGTIPLLPDLCKHFFFIFLFFIFKGIYCGWKICDWADLLLKLFDGFVWNWMPTERLWKNMPSVGLKMMPTSPSSPFAWSAAATVYTAQCTLEKTPVWNDVLKCHTGYSKIDIM